MIDYESGRKLATIERVLEIKPIENADRIEVAVVRNWNVVVGKGDFAVGDNVVYFEIDTALPLGSGSPYDFLAPRGAKVIDARGYHILHTIRLRGTYSQGLIMPVSVIFPNTGHYLSEGDCTLMLGLGKWEPPVPVDSGDVAGPYPSQLARKTDAERVQNLAHCWDSITAQGWHASEKVDGTSATLTRAMDGSILVSSRNWLISEGDNLYWNVVRDFFGEDPEIVEGEAIQFEIAGPGVQKNPLGLRKLRPFIFGYSSAREPIGLWDLPQRYQHLRVPIYNMELPSTIDEAVAQVDGIKSLISPQCKAEGVVWHQIYGPSLPELDYRRVVKVISNSYLLKASND